MTAPPDGLFTTAEAARALGIDTEINLHARRTALRLTQQQLGERLGVSRNTIARWERGELTIATPRMLWLALDALEHQHPWPAAQTGDKENKRP